MRGKTIIQGIVAAVIAAIVAGMSVAYADVYSDQYQRAIKGVLANTLPNGAVIASPSRNNPDYYYDWVRDTSLTMRIMIRLQADMRTSKSLRDEFAKRVNTWVDWELARQEARPTIKDLGEPRFYVDGRVNLNPWGRPQNDGPALRALAAMELAQQWIAQGRFDDVKAKLYRAELPARTMIKRDLEYIAHHFQEQSCDLWEEEHAMHYYTLVAQMVALTKGSKLAAQLGDGDAAKFYGQQAAAIQQYLGNFIDRQRGIIKYAINKSIPLPHKKSDLDVAVLLIAVQTFDGKFYVPVKETVNTVNAIVADFKARYPVNRVMKSPKGMDLGVALGRYPDDVYSGYDFSGGNPWFLATLALGEFACDLKKAGVYAQNARAQLDQTAIAQFNRVLYHLAPGGAMSEQFRRDTGYQQGAHDLTWSYSSYITAYRACF